MYYFRHSRLAYIAPLFLMSSCYPAYRTIEPYGLVEVYDNQGQPLSGSKVYFKIKQYPYGDLYSHNFRITDLSGQATFDGLYEWRIDSLMLHGKFYYDLDICVEKEGYANYVQSFNSVLDLDDKVHVNLKSGKAYSCFEQSEAR